jgi:hypothetical protein
VQERLKICKSGVPTLAGSKCSSLNQANSSTGQTVRYLMLKIAKMKKDKPLVLKQTNVELINNGKYFILTRLKRQRPRDSMKSLASTSTDHSTLYQSFHSTELLKCMVIPKLP